jgi:3-oxoacyl-[acyl-carrier protein] reductase
MKLQGHNTIITGGSQGLGKKIAEHFIMEGANIAICARNEKSLLETKQELLAMARPDQQVLARVCDVSSEAEVGEFVADAMERLGSLDSLILNAGIYGPMGPTEEVDLKEWRAAIEINLFGVLLPYRAIIPYFKKTNQGKIVIVSGGGATNPLPNISAYAASKAAVVRLMETLAEELKPWQIDVNAIAPGALVTRLTDEVIAAGPEKVGRDFFNKNRQWKANGATDPSLGANLALYLASRESNGITGKLISAQWDPWSTLHEYRDQLMKSDIYCLRRIVPEDRGQEWKKENL